MSSAPSARNARSPRCSPERRHESEGSANEVRRANPARGRNALVHRLHMRFGGLSGRDRALPATSRRERASADHDKGAPRRLTIANQDGQNRCPDNNPAAKGRTGQRTDHCWIKALTVSIFRPPKMAETSHRPHAARTMIRQTESRISGRISFPFAHGFHNASSCRAPQQTHALARRFGRKYSVVTPSPCRHARRQVRAGT